MSNLSKWQNYGMREKTLNATQRTEYGQTISWEHRHLYPNTEYKTLALRPEGTYAEEQSELQLETEYPCDSIPLKLSPENSPTEFHPQRAARQLELLPSPRPVLETSIQRNGEPPGAHTPTPSTSAAPVHKGITDCKTPCCCVHVRQLILICLEAVQDLSERFTAFERRQYALHAAAEPTEAAASWPHRATTMEEFHILNEHLRNGKAYNGMVNLLQNYVTNDLGSSVRRMLSATISNEVAKLCCWFGSPARAPVHRNELIAAIRDAIREIPRFAAEPISEIERHIKRWFINARDRGEGKRAR